MRRVLTIGLLALAGSLTAAADDDEKSVSELTKGMSRHDGLITLFRDEKKDKTYALIPSGLMDKPCLLAISMSKGPWTGILWNELTVAFQLRNKRLLMIEPETRFRAKSGTPLASSVTRTHVAKVLLDQRTLTTSGGVLIDAKSMFGSRDLAGLRYRAGRLRSSLTRTSKAKSFPENTELALDLIYGERQAQPVTVHFSLRKIPSSGYSPREADVRVGYFLTVAHDYDTPHQSRTIFKRYIQRWHLEKADPSLKLSPPKKPIVWYIEKTVPYRYRSTIRESILEWNKAFEKVGFTGAIVVRQQVEGGDFDDLDPEDARYNFFRWGTANVGFAFGPSRTNPMTGEILDASVYFDDSILRYSLGSYRRMSVNDRYATITDPKLVGLLEKQPRWRAFLGLDGLMPERKPAKRAKLPMHTGRCCMQAYGKAHKLALASLRLGKGGKLPEEYITQVLKEYVMHEIGHTLGLRHNFKASAWRKLSAVTGKDDVPAISASVMDYNAVNFPIDKSEAKNFQMRTIGPYDYWAIRYGYSVGASAKDLAKIASESTKPEHAYGTDEDSSSIDPDPLIRTWDLGDDPVAQAERTSRLVKTLAANLLERSVSKGESYSHARQAFMTLISEWGWANGLVAQMVGAVSLSRDVKGDKGARVPVAPYTGAQQRQALDHLAKHLFAGPPFEVKSSLLTHLAPARWSHWQSDQNDYMLTISVPGMIRNAQARSLFQLFNPLTLRRVESSALISDEKTPFDLAELFTRVDDAIWSELGQGGDKLTIALYRRNLQRLHTRLMIDLAVEGGSSVPADARALAWDRLRRLKSRIDTLLKGDPGMDATTEAHLREAAARAGHALEARFQRR